jgi:hypothetical protein
VIFATLNVAKRQINQLTPAQPAAEQDGQDGSIPLSLEGVRVGKLPKGASLSCG